jgi:hypothetical protein
MSSVPVARADDPDDPLTALMMGGTAMPTPSAYWQDTIVTDYINPATGDSYTPLVVPTPESAASTSLPDRLAELQTAMTRQPANLPYLVEGYSQSAQIAVDEKIDLIQAGSPPPRRHLPAARLRQPPRRRILGAVLRFGDSRRDGF